MKKCIFAFLLVMSPVLTSLPSSIKQMKKAPRRKIPSVLEMAEAIKNGKKITFPKEIARFSSDPKGLLRFLKKKAKGKRPPKMMSKRSFKRSFRSKVSKRSLQKQASQLQKRGRGLQAVVQSSRKFSPRVLPIWPFCPCDCPWGDINCILGSFFDLMWYMYQIFMWLTWWPWWMWPPFAKWIILWLLYNCLQNCTWPFFPLLWNIAVSMVSTW